MVWAAPSTHLKSAPFSHQHIFHPYPLEVAKIRPGYSRAIRTPSPLPATLVPVITNGPHSSGKSPLNDLIPVCVEGSVRQVDSDIDDFCNWFRGAHVARAAQEAFAAI